MVLPVIKLAFLAVKQVAKPVANRLKEGALSSDRLRGAMIKVGRRLHFTVFQIDRLADGKDMLKAERVRTLSEKEALTRGSDFLAEMVVYTFSAGILGAEQWISKQKEKRAELKQAAKEEAERESQRKNEERQWVEFEILHGKLELLQIRLAAMEAAEAERQASRAQKRGWWWA